MKEEVYVWYHYGKVVFFSGSNIVGLLQEGFERYQRGTQNPYIEEEQTT